MIYFRAVILMVALYTTVLELGNLGAMFAGYFKEGRGFSFKAVYVMIPVLAWTLFWLLGGVG